MISQEERIKIYQKVNSVECPEFKDTVDILSKLKGEELINEFRTFLSNMQKIEDSEAQLQLVKQINEVVKDKIIQYYEEQRSNNKNVRYRSSTLFF